MVVEAEEEEEGREAKDCPCPCIQLTKTMKCAIESRLDTYKLVHVVFTVG
jgi:hypothetical protein